MKQISDEEIEVIKKLLLQRNTHKQIKEILDNLEEVKVETKEKIN